ncbi:hypothetical protein BIV57_19685 [Mangrovactinospora gilvigrisea]|uniref:Phosphatidic acid phosphatase type 2/haloperoxidase domain-containing protein n=1 Tax=Mangrovactinospora gilvigrisea TaxID=1428644 RepID=A0A1J7C825_9ACTN|nr:phosphatase PAP2 family protein [Mangrovactinospora gilvigrisea]OIV35794.1 hypothetical protein BIV57_19685 [Mangrovactinospora gilvigrisea]
MPRNPKIAEARKRILRRPSRRHTALLVGLVAVHLALVIAVIFTLPIVHLDWVVMLKHPDQRLPQFDGFLNAFVVLGQRWPSVLMISPWILWKTWRERSWRPILFLGLAVLTINLFAGVFKVGLGRLGPHYNMDPWTSGIFHYGPGGDIMPSGHTSNAVVTWGLLAYLARHWRKRGAIAAGVLAGGIGATTVYLGTHWVSDVLDGWVVGALSLAVLPLAEPLVERIDLRAQALWFKLRRFVGPPLPELYPPLPEQQHDSPALPPAEPSATGRGAGPADSAGLFSRSRRE